MITAMLGLLKLLGVILLTTIGLAVFTRYQAHGLESQAEILGLPLVSIAQVGAKGWIAIGQANIQGVICLAQVGGGLVTIAQGGVGLLFGVGQGMVGLLVIAQLGLGALFFIGQVGGGLQGTGQAAFGIKRYLTEMNEEFSELLSLRRR